LLCDFSRVAGGHTICPREGGIPLNFGAVNVVLHNILGAADGLAILLRGTVDQATVDPTAVSRDNNDQRRGSWSVGAAFVPVIISQDVRDKHTFGFVGISGALTGPAHVSCKGVVDRVFMVIQNYCYFCYILVLSKN
jgi:hypothetical protein